MLSRINQKAGSRLLTVLLSLAVTGILIQFADAFQPSPHRISRGFPLTHTDQTSQSPNIRLQNLQQPLYATANRRSGQKGGSNLPDLSQRSFPPIPPSGYDLVVIGSGPGGEAAAVRSAQLGARVAVIEKRSAFGGPTGLTSKAVREAAKRICKAVDQVGGDRRKQVKGLWKRQFPALKTEAEVLQAAESRDKLKNNNVDLFIGEAKLIPRKEGDVVVKVKRGAKAVGLPTTNICIATGSRSHKPTHLPNGVQLPFTPGKVVEATEMGNMQQLPNSIAIIGGGVIAVEYATVLAELGVGVSLLCSESDFMPFLEADMRAALRKRMQIDHVLFVEEHIAGITIEDDSVAELDSKGRPVRKGVTVALEADQSRPWMQRKLRVDMVLYSGGRDANSEGLGCEDCGVRIEKYGQIAVHELTREAMIDSSSSSGSSTSIFAVGDVTGPPGLASSAMQQGRAVAQLLFTHKKKPILSRYDIEGVSETGGSSSSSSSDTVEGDSSAAGGSNRNLLFGSQVGTVAPDAPMTIWTIPEMASVGTTFAKAEERGAIPISEPGGTLVEGVAYFKDMARGRLSGDLDGFLKIVAAREGTAGNSHSHRIIGVHIFGEGANELIQLGSILVHSGATVEQVSQTPFAAVTLSGLFQMASDNCLEKSCMDTLVEY